MLLAKLISYIAVGCCWLAILLPPSIDTVTHTHTHVHTLRDIYVYHCHVMLCKERLNGFAATYTRLYTAARPRDGLSPWKAVERIEGSFEQQKQQQQYIYRRENEFRWFTSRESWAIAHKSMCKTVKCPLDNPRDLLRMTVVKPFILPEWLLEWTYLMDQV